MYYIRDMIDSDLKRCYDGLIAKMQAHDMRMQYYRGDHPIAFINPKFTDIIKRGVVFRKNWCQTIIDAALNKLVIQSWNAPDIDNDALADLWKRHVRRIANDVHLGALITGESFVVAWPGTDGAPRAYYHDPRTVHAVYDENEPETMRFACKIWTVEKRRRLNLYYPDRIEHYVANDENPISAQSFRPVSDSPVEPNQFGQIPVFHFRLRSDTNTGELTTGVLSLQDALNKILNDMMVASEYTSFPQRYAIGNFEKNQKWPIGPGTILELPGSAAGDQPVTVGSFSSSSPDNYLRPMEDLRDAMAVLSATPHYYFAGQGGTPSGEAIRALESPLLSKIARYQSILGGTWESLMAFMARISGIADGNGTDIECVWADAHTQLPQALAQTRLTNKNAGIPITTQLRDEGWTEGQIAQMINDINVEATVTSIPNTGAIPATVSPAVAMEARMKAKDMIAGKVAGGIADALESARKPVPENAVAQIMGKFADKRVRT